MHGTMSDSAKLAMALLVFGFVLFIMASVTLLGMSFSRGFTDNITGTYTEINGMEIDSIAAYNGDLPAATVYIAVSKNRELVEQISGTAYGVTVTQIDDLQKLFKNQIHVTVLKNNNDGSYRLTISP